jgi:hypothetical protein
MRDYPSTRQLWKRFRQILVEDGGFDRRDLVLAQEAFYAGVRVMWKVLGHLAEDDEPEELVRPIEKPARQVFAIQGLAPRKRRH